MDFPFTYIKEIGECLGPTSSTNAELIELIRRPFFAPRIFYGTREVDTHTHAHKEWKKSVQAVAVCVDGCDAVDGAVYTGYYPKIPFQGSLWFEFIAERLSSGGFGRYFRKWWKKSARHGKIQRLNLNFPAKNIAWSQKIGIRFEFSWWDFSFIQGRFKDSRMGDGTRGMDFFLIHPFLYFTGRNRENWNFSPGKMASCPGGELKVSAFPVVLCATEWPHVPSLTIHSWNEGVIPQELTSFLTNCVTFSSHTETVYLSSIFDFIQFVYDNGRFRWTLLLP